MELGTEALSEMLTIETLLVGEMFRHFKGEIYVVDGSAIHTETGEIMIIYHNIHREYPYEFFVRPMDMFLSKVDKKKYPDSKQEYRFERISASGIIK